MSTTPEKKANKGRFTKENPGPGRPKGVPNKITQTITEALEQSFAQVGGAEYLVRLAENYPQAYAALIGKRIPNNVHIQGALQLEHLFTPDQLRRMADAQERRSQGE